VDLILSITIVAVALAILGFYIWKQRRDRITPPLPPVEPPPPVDEPALSPTVLALSRALDDGLMLVGPDLVITYANDAVGRLLGVGSSGVEGQSLITVVRDFQADQAVQHALASGEMQVASLQIPRSRRTIRLTCQPLGENGTGAVVVLRDLTQLAHLERARREMVANVSHELRTPLASIRLLVETLTLGPPPELAQRMLGQIDDELASMTQLVDELRELSQIESGRLMLRLSEVPISALVERAFERLRPQLERRGLRFDTALVPDLQPVLVDEERVGQVFLNLLHNALKWTPEGGSITVAAVPAGQAADQRTIRELGKLDAGEWIRVSVRDTGIGIPRDETERVFERFYKVDRARTRDSGGTGLGLAIAKHLIERHGGRIWVESEEGQGSTFTMLLPAAR
jgi:two-component system, OmpR family, phosphate regulon sensor histidine kinase PhoR